MINLKELPKIIHKVTNFIEVEIWHINLPDEPQPRRFFLRSLKGLLIAFKGFKDDNIQIRASSLTFYSMLSIVPVLAMAFGIAKGFGLDALLDKELRKAFEGQEEILNKTLEFADSMLQTTKGGFIAGIGLLILFWSILQLLNNIEDSFNNIWGVKKSRIFVRKFTDYFSIMLFAPVLFIVSSSVTVYITTRIEDIVSQVNIQGIQYVTPFIFSMIKLIPYTLIWLLLTLIYIIMPNTSVNFKSAFVAGIIAGTAYQLTQWGYVNFQVGVSRYNTIYGSFAALPLFLVWLQLSWFIVLFGAEIAYALQNVEKFGVESDSLKLSPSYKKILSLYILHFLVKNFKDEISPNTVAEISQKLKIPSLFIRQVIDDLVKVKLVAQSVSDDMKEIAYMPGRDISKISITTVIESLEDVGLNSLNLDENKEFHAITSYLDSFRKALQSLPENKLLKDI